MKFFDLLITPNYRNNMMKTEVTTMTINGVEYIRADSVKESQPVAMKLNGLPYVVVRTYSAGCFAGYLKSRQEKAVVLKDARRLWFWKGASSLSQLAMEGVKYPKDCKFPCEVAEILLTEVIEIIQATETAKQNIAKVAIWKQ